MQISTKDWKNYIRKLSQMNDLAAQKMREYVAKNGFADTDALISYAYALATKYGEGSAEITCQMYDAIAEMEGKILPPAEPAETASYDETAKAIKGCLKRSPNGSLLASTSSRLVKQVGADTMVKNALRDGAEFAWVPNGDTCSFCIMLASNGWKRASKKAIRKGHAEHIHANCDCQYCVRFSPDTTVAGYEPDKYKQIYDSYDGNWEEKLRAMRRDDYSQNKDKINAQKRAAYSNRKKQSFLFRTDLNDEVFPKSIGAKWQNYDIMNLATGETYHIAEGSKIQDKEVFAGKGSKTPYRDAYKYAEKYGGNTEDWQHVKAKCVIKIEDEEIPAEIHWSQCEGIGKFDLFVKRWLDES